MKNEIKSIRKQDRINVLFIIDYFGFGGTEKQLSHLITGLSKNLFCVHLCTLKDHKAKYPNVDNVKYVYYKIKRLFSLTGIISFLKLIAYLRKNRIAIVQTYFRDATYFGVLAAILARIKIILTSRRDLGYWRNKKNISIMKMINRAVKKVIVNSNAIKQSVVEYEELNDDLIEVIYNGVEPLQINLSEQKQRIRRLLVIPNDAYVIGIVSNFNRKVKRVDIFIEGAYEILKKCNNSYFIVIGDGRYRDDLESQVVSYNMSKNFRFVGRIHDPLPYICAFDIGINTSESEGFSNAILEYMLCGCPCVVTDNPGNVELVENNKRGLLFPVNDAKQMANAVFKVFEDNKKRKEMIESAREFVQTRCSIRSMIDSHEKLYLSLCKPLVKQKK